RGDQQAEDSEEKGDRRQWRVEESAGARHEGAGLEADGEAQRLPRLQVVGTEGETRPGRLRERPGGVTLLALIRGEVAVLRRHQIGVEYHCRGHLTERLRPVGAVHIPEEIVMVVEIPG